MTTEKLRDSVRSIPGVASAEVSLGRDQEPLVKVWTDGTRPEADVRSAVEAARLAAMSDPDVEPGDRSDQGRVPNAVTPEASPEWTPGQPDPAVEVASPTGRIARLAIEESFDCVEVRASDSSGHSGTAVVGDGEDGLNEAIAVAVARLRGVEKPTSIRIDVRDVDGSEVVNALLDLPSGDRVVGAAIATGGRPFTLGRAVDAALSDVR
jgi:hypothetical protein